MVDTGKPLGRPGSAKSTSGKGVHASGVTQRRRITARCSARDKACLAVARRAGNRDSQGRAVRGAKLAAIANLREYAEQARKANIIMALRRCSWESVRAARGANLDELLWFVTPRAVVNSVGDIDEELVDEEAEADDDCEAERFAGECDDEGDDDYVYSEDESVRERGEFTERSGLANGSATNGVVLGKEYEVDEDGFDRMGRN